MLDCAYCWLVTSKRSKIKLGGIFLERNEHQNLTRFRRPIVIIAYLLEVYNSLDTHGMLLVCSGSHSLKFSEFSRINS